MTTQELQAQRRELAEQLTKAEAAHAQALEDSEALTVKLHALRVQHKLGEVTKDDVATYEKKAGTVARRLELKARDMDTLNAALEICGQRLKEARTVEKLKATDRAESQRQARTENILKAWRQFEAALVDGVREDMAQDRAGLLPRRIPGGWRANSVLPLHLLTHYDRTGELSFRPVLQEWAERLRQSSFPLSIDADARHKLDE